MTQVGVINEFRNEYAFLGNFFVSTFKWRGLFFKSGEQAFSYAKTLTIEAGEDIDAWQAKVLAAPTPSKAKAVGRSMPINVAAWDKRKVPDMRGLVHAKFSTGEGNLVGSLINTGATMLIEGNTWGDQFWGRTENADGTWSGLNVLGVILMEERGLWSRGSLSQDNQ